MFWQAPGPWPHRLKGVRGLRHGALRKPRGLPQSRGHCTWGAAHVEVRPGIRYAPGIDPAISRVLFACPTAALTTTVCWGGGGGGCRGVTPSSSYIRVGSAVGVDSEQVGTPQRQDDVPGDNDGPGQWCRGHSDTSGPGGCGGAVAAPTTNTPVAPKGPPCPQYPSTGTRGGEWACGAPVSDPKPIIRH